MTHRTTILVPIDFSSATRGVLNHAVTLARAGDAALLLLYVIDPAPFIGPQTEFTAGLRQALEDATAQAESGINALAIEPGVAIERLVLVGNPADQIVALAAQDHVNAIVMGTNSSNGRPREALGTTAESVLHRAKCKVITLKRPSRARDVG